MTTVLQIGNSAARAGWKVFKPRMQQQSHLSQGRRWPSRTISTAEGRTHFLTGLPEHQAISRNHYPALSHQLLPHCASTMDPWNVFAEGPKAHLSTGFQPAALSPWLRGFCDRSSPLSPPPSQASRLLVPALIERFASPGEVSQRQRAGTSPLTSILLSALFIKQQQQVRGPAPAHTNNTLPMKQVTPAPWDKRTSSSRQFLSNLKSMGAMERKDGDTTRTSSSQTCKLSRVQCLKRYHHKTNQKIHPTSFLVKRII